MPNYSRNSLRISTPTIAALTKVKSLMFHDDSYVPTYDTRWAEKLDFGILLSPPKNAQPSTEYIDQYKGNLEGYYDKLGNKVAWKDENWGTRNAVDVSEPFEDDKMIEVTFNTAWAPPLPWVQALSAAVPEAEITLIFFEDAWGMSGKYVYIAGEEVTKDYRNKGYRENDEYPIDLWIESAWGEDYDEYVELNFLESTNKMDEMFDNGSMLAGLCRAIITRYEKAIDASSPNDYNHSFHSLTRDPEAAERIINQARKIIADEADEDAALAEVFG